MAQQTLSDFPKSGATIHWMISSGINSSKFRDMATSPLFYEGAGVTSNIGRQKAIKNRVSEIGMGTIQGAYIAKVGKQEATSTFNRVEFYYSQLFNVSRFSNESWKLQAGGYFSLFGNIRENPDLLNNALGVELIQTLFGSVKVSHDISRESLIQKHLLFLHYKLKPKNRDLSYRVNVGLMNSDYRNGYVYLNQSWLLEKEGKVFDNYQFHAFSGLRMGTELNYTRYLTSGNAIRWTMASDLYRTGANPDRLEVAHYILKFTLLFHTK
jgi:hypothetical protein